MKQNLLYKVPKGINDDCYWLYVSFLCNDKCLLVTNDEMRDHHFQMMHERTFVLWKELHQVRFSFGFRGNAEVERECLLEYPKKYTRKIQCGIGNATTDDNNNDNDDGNAIKDKQKKGIVIPMCKKGDANRFLDGIYVADDNEPDEETYLCICPN